MGTRFGTAGWGPGGVLSDVDEDGLSSYEDHFQIVDSEDRNEVYELVAVDVNGNPTNVLEQAAASAKGQSTFAVGFRLYPAYDTTRVEGEALTDVDYTFNSELGLDRLTYLMNAEPLAGNVNIDVRVWYQSMPARWIESMFDVQDSTIQAFQTLFNAQGCGS